MEAFAVGPVLKRVVTRFRARGLVVEVQAAPIPAVTVPEDALLSGLLDKVQTHALGAAARVVAGTVDAELHLAVHDDRPGIAAAHRVRAFEPFFTTARERGGSGLGCRSPASWSRASADKST